MRTRIGNWSIFVTLSLATLDSPAQTPSVPMGEKQGSLEVRCRRMLQMQEVVLAGTKTLAKSIAGNPTKLPSVEDHRAARKLAEGEKALSIEADLVVKMLEADKSVAFAEVFVQLRDDMKEVEHSLTKRDVGLGMQNIQVDIIDTLKEMIVGHRR